MALMSLRAYARHRGCSLNAVQTAIRAGRLQESVTRNDRGQPKIANPELADREWEATTDYSKAPGAVKAAAAARAQGHTVSERGQTPNGRSRVPDGVAVPSELSLAEESAREKFWRAHLAELEFRRRSGELVDATQMQARIADVFTRVRTRLLGLPTRAKQQIPHLEIADVNLLDSLVREALEALAVELEDTDEDDDA
jgi:phage terminase Nu1 subunit (DNA packaging protein)